MATSATMSTSGSQTGASQTGTDDKVYNLTSVLYHALQGVENCEIYGEDADDDQLRQFFDQACEQQRQIADQAKRLLHDCLMQERQGGQSAGSGQSGQGGSAFGFGGSEGAGGTTTA